MKKLFFFYGDAFIIAVGFILICYGGYLQGTHGSELQALTLGVNYALKAVVGVGFFLVIVGVLAGFAASKSSVILMQLSIGCLLFALIMQIGLGGMALTNRMSVQTRADKMYEEMKARFNDLKENGVEWGEMERKNHCCGLDSFSDYGLFGKYALNGILNALKSALGKIPVLGNWLGDLLTSATDRVNEIINFKYPKTCLTKPDDVSSPPFMKGCYKVAKDLIDKAVLVVGAFSIASSTVTILMICLACQLITDIMNPPPMDQRYDVWEEEEREEEDDESEDEDDD